MKCPKCNYVSHDYLDACRKCGIDLVMFKQDIGLVVLQPGTLDLSLVLGGVGADDLFASIEEEIPMYASDDDDFDLSLDDYAEHQEVRQAPTGGLHPVRPEPEMDLTEMDHLTLELEAVDLPPDLLEEGMSAGAPPSHAAPGAPETQEATAPRQLARRHRDFMHLTSAPMPEVEGKDALAGDPAAAVDGAVVTPESQEPPASDLADVGEPALTTLDEPRLQAMGRLSSFEDEWAPLTIESIPEDMLISADMLLLEDLPETILPGHLTLELDASVLPVDLASHLLADATPGSPSHTPQLPAGTSTFADLDDITLPGHLTLELERSDMASEVSSIILDSVQRDPPSADLPAQRSPGEDHANDEAELCLDLDNLECDGDKPA